MISSQKDAQQESSLEPHLLLLPSLFAPLLPLNIRPKNNNKTARASLCIAPIDLTYLSKFRKQLLKFVRKTVVGKQLEKITCTVSTK